MRFKISLFLLLSFSIFSFSQEGSEEKTDIENYGFVKNTIYVKETTYNGEKNGEKITKGKLESIEENWFNSAGYLTKKVVLNNKIEQVSKEVYIYNSKNQLIVIKKFRKKDTPAFLTTFFTYNKKGLVKGEITINKHSYVGTDYHYYSIENKLIKLVSKNAKGEIEFSRLIEYDYNNNFAGYQILDEKGELYHGERYTNDSKGNPTKTTGIGSSKGYDYTHKNEYDENGNVVLQIRTSLNDGVAQKRESKYNTQNKQIEYVGSDSVHGITSKANITFDENGNKKMVIIYSKDSDSKEETYKVLEYTAN